MLNIYIEIMASSLRDHWLRVNSTHIIIDIFTFNLFKFHLLLYYLAFCKDNATS